VPLDVQVRRSVYVVVRDEGEVRDSALITRYVC
jgi:hypothetical protein